MSARQSVARAARSALHSLTTTVNIYLHWTGKGRFASPAQPAVTINPDCVDSPAQSSLPSRVTEDWLPKLHTTSPAKLKSFKIFCILLVGRRSWSSSVQFLGLVSVAAPLSSSLLQFDVKDGREEMPNILCWLLCGLLRHYIITASAAACAVNPNELQSLAGPAASS